MQLNINGQPHEVADNPEGVLLWALRDELGMTGTKFGCGAGICGACTVHVNGNAQRACITPLASLEGADIRTIEGLATIEADGTRQLHPVQQAFIEHQVPQCGWCMSGQLMHSAAFLENHEDITALEEEEVVTAMSGNYCRCGCYVRIKSAVIEAAHQMAADVSQTGASQSEVAS